MNAIMKIGLRDKIKEIDFLDPDRPYLERIGALYYWGRQIDRQDGQANISEKLRSLLNPSALYDKEELLLCLHAAILLAQSGDFDGIDFILVALDSLRRTANRAQIELTETALRNCSEYPLAVLIAQSIDLGNVSGHSTELREMMGISNDSLLAYSQKKNQERHFQTLANQLNLLKTLPRQNGRELALGTIISRPVRKDFGYRYTGFVAIERGNQPPLIVSYDMGDVLNRDDQHVKQDVWQLLRRPGHRAIVVFDIDPPYEAQQFYILPFASQSEQETEALIARLAREVVGLEVGVVAELSVDKYKGYRVITANGKSSIAHYRAKHQKIGDCFLIHEMNSQLLSTRFRLSKEDVSQVADQFKQNNQMDRAIHLKSHQGRHLLGSSQGNICVSFGEISAEKVYFVEDVIIKDNTRYFPFEVPGISWTPHERSRVLSAFFNKQPDAWGVVLETYDYKSKKYARIIHPQSGSILRPRIDQDYPAGTIAFCEMGDDNHWYANIMAHYLIQGGCSDCFGTSYRICQTCNGDGDIACSTCSGTGRIVCGECGGGGKIQCGKCAGTGTCTKCTAGYWRNGRPCPICNATGICNSCKPPGSGEWDCGVCHQRGNLRCNQCNYGKVKCPTCDGERISRCGCGGNNRGYIIAV